MSMAAKRPNIIFILSDQHRHASLPGMDGCEVLAPNLEAMALRGLSLHHCYSNAPVCGPARGMLMSGHWPTETGVMGNDMELPDTSFSLGHRMAEQNYHPLYIGKWHLHAGDAEPDSNCRWVPPGHGRHGFERLIIWNCTNDHWKSHYYDETDGRRCEYDGYNAIGMTDQALSMIDEYATDKQPFFLWLNYNPPHPPLDDAPPNFLKFYQDQDLTLRPNVPDEYATGETLVPPGGRYNDPCMTLQQQLAHYYGHISAIDQQIGRIRDRLATLGCADDTIVIYSSDHGDMLWSQGMLRKGQYHQESARVPFIAEGPGIDMSGSSTLMSTIDIYPTLLGFAGCQRSGSRGTDCSKALGGDASASPHEAIHFFNSGPNQRVAIRTRQYLYLKSPDQALMYDTRADPWEMHNVIDDPDYADVRTDLDRRLTKRLEQAWSHPRWDH